MDKELLKGRCKEKKIRDTKLDSEGMIKRIDNGKEDIEHLQWNGKSRIIRRQEHTEFGVDG